MSPIPEVVADPTDDGTLRPNIEPEPTTGDHFEPLFCPEFPHSQALPPDVESDDPFGIWSLFFTTKIMELIVQATNIRGRHRRPAPSQSDRPAKTQLPGSCSRRWFDLTIWELYSYFAILIYMATTKLSQIELYWGSDHGKHEYVVLAMSCNRFQDISRNLCFTNGKTGEFDRVQLCFSLYLHGKLTKTQVEPLREWLLKAFLKYWKPGWNVAVDECMIGFTGKCLPEIFYNSTNNYVGWRSSILKIPSKPISEGYKAWAIAQNGYILGWLWHAKKKGPVGLPQSAILPELEGNKTVVVVLFLLESLPKVPLPNRYVVFLDNLFTSTKLLWCLHKRGYGAVGTCRTNLGICQPFVDRKARDKKEDLIL